MLSFYRHSRICSNYSHKLFTSVLGDISNPCATSNSGHRSELQDVFSSKTTTALHQICRNLSTGKKIDAANSLNDSDKIKKTCLYEFHVSHGGKMVDFAGYSLPIQYGKQGIAASHKHTRKHCSIFDVSHMLQTRVRGKDALSFIEQLCVADVKQGLQSNQSTLSVFTNSKGGIIDDLIVTKLDETNLYIVSNAGCRHKDMPLMQQKIEEMQKNGKDVSLEFMENHGLIALQGPESAKVLQPLTSVDLSKMAFMTGETSDIAGVGNCRITRCGYTGEDGFELSITEDKITEVTETLLSSSAGSVELSGLGARDSLRLEAGLCLYGNDIDEDTTPIEAGLTWTIGKRRRVVQNNEEDFPGAEIILRQLKEKPSRKRVGLVSQGPPARSHTPVIDPSDGKQIGEVTSGCPAPSMEGSNVNVGMAYLPSKMSKSGTKVLLRVRNKDIEATVSKMPFVPSNYYSLK